MFKPCLGKTLIGDEEIAKLTDVIAHQNLFRYNVETTSYCAQSECQISEMLKVKHCLVITNCTNALKSALVVLGPEPGEIVLIPAISFIATASACLTVGLIPVMIDVDDSGHMDPEALSDFLRKNPPPFAVIAVHLDGSGCQIHEIASICRQYGVHLIEDTARSFSVTRKGQHLGTFGEVGCFSFQENKILSTGEGGAVVTHNSGIFEKLSAYCDHGAKRYSTGYPYWEQNLGYGENFKANELTAAVLLAQLNKTEMIRSRLKDHYRILSQDLGDAVFPRHDEDIPTVAWIDSSRLVDHLKRAKVPLVSWDRWFLPQHPIIQEKRSFYRNSYPWNLLKVDQLPACEKARRICQKRHNLPIPIPEEDFALLQSCVKEQS
jgi:perosamine synthetase